MPASPPAAGDVSALARGFGKIAVGTQGSGACWGWGCGERYGALVCVSVGRGGGGEGEVTLLLLLLLLLLPNFFMLLLRVPRSQPPARSQEAELSAGQAGLSSAPAVQVPRSSSHVPMSPLRCTENGNKMPCTGEQLPPASMAAAPPSLAMTEGKSVTRIEQRFASETGGPLSRSGVVSERSFTSTLARGLSDKILSRHASQSVDEV